MWNYVPSLFAALLFVGLVGRESLHPAVSFRYPRDMSRLRHAALNLGVGLVGTLITYLAFLPLWRVAEAWCAQSGHGLLYALPERAALRLPLTIGMLDLWTYWWHRWNHRNRFLWRFHRMHHSDAWMDVSTAKRFHPGELTLSAALRIPIIALTGIRLSHMALYDAVMLSVVFFHHANIALPETVDRLLRLVIPTPLMHKVHHSRLQPETDSNYTSLLSVWDRVFGSLRLTGDWRAISFGLDGYDGPADRSFAGMIRTPARRKPPGPEAG